MVNRIDQANAQSTSNITNMVEEMNNLRAEIAALKKNKSKGIVEIPPGLSKSVHVAYGPLKENGWNFELKFNSIINEQVNSSILTAIKDGGLDHDLKVVRKATRRYFESQKRRWKLQSKSPEEIEGKARENRRAVRRHRLYTQRDKLVKEDEDAHLWEQATVWHMSDVETDEENETRLVYKSIPWRSDDLSDLILRCDNALGVIRARGSLSARPSV